MNPQIRDGLAFAAEHCATGYTSLVVILVWPLLIC
jgi:hypothetical protein